jgi:hypothetical protein
VGINAAAEDEQATLKTSGALTPTRLDAEGEQPLTAAEVEQEALKTSRHINADATRCGRRVGFNGRGRR